MIDLMDGDTTVEPGLRLLAGRTCAGCARSARSRHRAVARRRRAAYCTSRTPTTTAHGRQATTTSPTRAAGDGPGYRRRRRRPRSATSPGLFEKMNEPFKATGFGDLPWYAVFGNHDGLVQGNQPRNPALEALAIGCVEASNGRRRRRSRGDPRAARGATGHAAMQRAAATLRRRGRGDRGRRGATTPIVPPDPRRRPLRKQEWIAEHFDTTGSRSATASASARRASSTGMGNYAFDRRPGRRRCASSRSTRSPRPGLDERQRRRRRSSTGSTRELRAADAAGKYVDRLRPPLAADDGPAAGQPVPARGDHGGNQRPARPLRQQPGSGQPTVPCDSPTNAPGSGPRRSAASSCRHPSVIAFVNGHEHNNRVDPIERRDGAGTLSGGFWEVNTASHIDWPQQARTIDLSTTATARSRSSGRSSTTPPPPNPGGPPAPRAGQGQAGESVKRLASISRELSFNDPDADHSDATATAAAAAARDDRNVELLVRNPYGRGRCSAGTPRHESANRPLTTARCRAIMSRRVLALSPCECQIDRPYGGQSHEAQAPRRSADRAGDRGGGDDRQRHRPPRHREGEAAARRGHRRRRRPLRRRRREAHPARRRRPATRSCTASTAAPRSRSRARTCSSSASRTSSPRSSTRKNPEHMAHKELKYDVEARQALEAGVDAVANAVKVTLGPKGRYVVLDKKFGAPTITNDGVTIAREIEVEDVFENQGAQLVREVATATNDVAGDGTTTATVLAQQIVRDGLKNVTAGANPLGLKRGIEKAVEPVVDHIQVAVQGGLRQGPDRARRDHLGRRRRDRRRHRRRHREGRQGRRRERRGGPDVRHGPRVHRGHAVRQGLHLALHGHRPGPHGGRARGSVHPHRQPEDRLGPGHAPDPRGRHPVRQVAADHRRGRRGRGPRDARREQAARHVHRRRRQGAGLRRPPQAHARGHRDPHRRRGHHRGDGPQAREHADLAARARPPRRRGEGQHDDRRRRR